MPRLLLLLLLLLLVDNIIIRVAMVILCIFFRKYFELVSNKSRFGDQSSESTGMLMRASMRLFNTRTSATHRTGIHIHIFTR
jgi:hypothetical protein